MTLLLGLAAMFVVACGSSSKDKDKGLLPAAQSRTLSAELASISTAVSDHSCARAASAINQFENTLANLPTSVSQRLAQNLGDGASTVKSLALTDCHKVVKPVTTTSTTSSSTTSTTVTTTSTPATTSSTPTTPSTPATTTATPPVTTLGTTPATTPGGNTGGGNGSGNGNGNGGAGLTGGGG